MLISIIIPVYNAAPFIEKAVLSALEQPETHEVLLIEDNSPDDSLRICEALAAAHERVKLLRHPNGENRGAGASRNLGIAHASCPWIAFLDADDFYLPNRFQIANQVIAQHPDTDGVYEAIGSQCDDSGEEQSHTTGLTFNLTTILTPNIPPSYLYEFLIATSGNHIHLNGLLVSKTLAEKVGRFDETLRQTQDTDFIWKIALAGQLRPGSLVQPVAMRGVHANNRVFNRPEARHYARILHRRWFLRMLGESWSRRINWGFVRKKLESEALYWCPVHQRGVLRVVKACLLPWLCLRHPRLLSKLFF